MTKYNVSLCAMYRNEAPYLREWIEYHRLIGVNHFYLYNNLSTDDHLSILRRYIDDGIVSYHDYDFDFSNVHPRVPWTHDSYPYNHCPKTYMKETQWIGFIDLDEFIVLRRHTSIYELMKNYPKADGLALNWLIFGSSSHYLEPSGLITENYVLRGPHPRNKHVKSIVKPSTIVRWATPHLPTTNGSGVVKENGRVCTSPIDTEVQDTIAVIHHYERKSKEYYLFRKVARNIPLDRLKTSIVNDHLKNDGSFANTFYQNILLWEDNNRFIYNSIEDRSLDRYLPELRSRCGLVSNISSMMDLQIHNWKSYWDASPELRKYLLENIHRFSEQSMSGIFHYWFLFDIDNKKHLISVRDLIGNLNLDCYRNQEFTNYLRPITKLKDPPITPMVIYKFYLDYEMWVPLNFDWKDYIRRKSLKFNRYQAIQHWTEHGRFGK